MTSMRVHQGASPGDALSATCAGLLRIALSVGILASPTILTAHSEFSQGADWLAPRLTLAQIGQAAPSEAVLPPVTTDRPLAPNLDPHRDDNWEFAFTPYLWLAGISGDVGFSGVNLPLDVGFSTLTEDLEVAFMGAAGGRYRRFALLADGNWLQLEAAEPLSGILAHSQELDLTLAFGTAMVQYQLTPSPDLTISPYLGARWWLVDATVALQGGLLDGAQVDFNRAWADPVVGVALHYEIAKGWYVAALGDVGAGISNLTWQLYGTTGYHCTHWLAITVGYRFLGEDYSRDNFTLDIVTQGLLLGLELSF
jgi:hypothetical protein